MKRAAGSAAAPAQHGVKIQVKKTKNASNFSESNIATLTLKEILPHGIESGMVTEDSQGNQIIQIQNDVEMGESSMVDEDEDDIDDVPNESCDIESGVIAQHMDITEPLTTLRSLLEQRVGFSLIEYDFYLQDAQILDASKNLVNQCVQGEGLVQVNVEITEKDYLKKINIVDVLKPAEEIVTVTPEDEAERPPDIGQPAVRKTAAPNEDAEQVTRWVASPEFRERQEKLKIPAEPSQWKPSHVRHWIQWAVNHFNLQGISLSDWDITGKEICDLSHGDFTKKVPLDPGDLFWTHLELLRKCQIVAVVQQPSITQQVNQIYTIVTKSMSMQARGKAKNQRTTSPRVAYEGCPGNRSGNNGQIQLWQFLLEMLTDFQCRDYIQWIGVDGEFKLNNPEMVAQLWGQRKNKPTMNYEKLSRALRYYYDGDMIAKVHGKRFVYKFVCDLKSLLGYNAAELKRLVSGCSDGKINQNSLSGGTIVPYMVDLNQGLVLANTSS